MTTSPKLTLRNAEEWFRSHFPTARVEGHTGHDRKRYYLVRLRGEQMWCGEGNTKAHAWKDACERKSITGPATGGTP